MNVKDIIRNRSVKHFMLKLFAWLPECVMLPLQYRMILHRKLDIKNPKRFTEWVQWYKAFYPMSGYFQFNPDDFDYTLGNCFKTAAEELQINL